MYVFVFHGIILNEGSNLGLCWYCSYLFDLLLHVKLFFGFLLFDFSVIFGVPSEETEHIDFDKLFFSWNFFSRCYNFPVFFSRKLVHAFYVGRQCFKSSTLQVRPVLFLVIFWSSCEETHRTFLRLCHIDRWKCRDSIETMDVDLRVDWVRKSTRVLLRLRVLIKVGNLIV